MKILDHVKSIQLKAKAAGNYAVVSHDSGVSYQWLAKFAQGRLHNPTVGNINKLEEYFNSEKSLPPR